MWHSLHVLFTNNPSGAYTIGILGLIIIMALTTGNSQNKRGG